MRNAKIAHFRSTTVSAPPMVTGFSCEYIGASPTNLDYVTGLGGYYRGMTFSTWLKRSAVGVEECITMGGRNANNTCKISILVDNRLRVHLRAGAEEGGDGITVEVLDDTSIWYHIFVVVNLDTAGPLNTDMCRVWLNGVEATMTYPSDFEQGVWRCEYFQDNLYIGADRLGLLGPLSGLMYNTYAFNESYQDVNSFGEDLGSGWLPKEFVGSYGIYDIFLDYEVAANLGLDASPNGYDLIETNITAANQSIEIPQGTGGAATYEQLTIDGDPLIVDGDPLRTQQ